MRGLEKKYLFFYIITSLCRIPKKWLFPLFLEKDHAHGVYCGIQYQSLAVSLRSRKV